VLDSKCSKGQSHLFPLELYSASENICFLPVTFLNRYKSFLFSPSTLLCRCYILSNKNGKIHLSLRQSRYVLSLLSVDLLLVKKRIVKYSNYWFVQISVKH